MPRPRHTKTRDCTAQALQRKADLESQAGYRTPGWPYPRPAGHVHRRDGHNRCAKAILRRLPSAAAHQTRSWWPTLPCTQRKLTGWEATYRRKALIGGGGLGRRLTGEVGPGLKSGLSLGCGFSGKARSGVKHGGGLRGGFLHSFIERPLRAVHRCLHGGLANGRAVSWGPNSVLATRTRAPTSQGGVGRGTHPRRYRPAISTNLAPDPARGEVAKLISPSPSRISIELKAGGSGRERGGEDQRISSRPNDLVVYTKDPFSLFSPFIRGEEKDTVKPNGVRGAKGPGCFVRLLSDHSKDGDFQLTPFVILSRELFFSHSCPAEAPGLYPGADAASSQRPLEEWGLSADPLS
jgi:hypothetical protein